MRATKSLIVFLFAVVISACGGGGGSSGGGAAATTVPDNTTEAPLEQATSAGLFSVSVIAMDITSGDDQQSVIIVGLPLSGNTITLE